MDIACVNILNQLIFFFFLNIRRSVLHDEYKLLCTVLFHRHDSNSQGVDVGVKNI